VTGWTVKDKLSYYTNVIKIKLYLMRKSSGLKKTKKQKKIILQIKGSIIAERKSRAVQSRIKTQIALVKILII